MNRFLTIVALALFGRVNASDTDKPNIVLFFIDDLGYGDLACYGNEQNQTPFIDQMSEEGMLFTDFYVSAPVCTPSRASLLTGCYPKRVDMHFDAQMRPVLFPKAIKGLNPDEYTVAEMLKDAGYTTACMGKWHLGDQKEFLPPAHGFDYYYGIPYSNNMQPADFEGWPPLPMVINSEVDHAPVNQDSMTYNLTMEAIRFMEGSGDKPFFVYIPHPMVHRPLHVSGNFQDDDPETTFKEALAEVDWSVGEIMSYLEKKGKEQNTLVIFISDNGASGCCGGTNSPLRGWKGETWEGGMRVPCIMKWPGVIPAGSTCKHLATNLDIFPTLAEIAGGRLPENDIDGYNITGLMKAKEGAVTPYTYFGYYKKDELQAVRWKEWKLHVPNKNRHPSMWKDTTVNFKGELYNLETDIGETNNVFDQYPEIVERLLGYAGALREEFGDYGMCSPYIRMAGYDDEPEFLMDQK